MEYITKKGIEDTDGEKPLESEIKICEDWIKAFVIERKSVNTEKRSSAGLKNSVELWHGNHQYISNGSFIQAAVNLGYKYKRIGSGSDAYFNMIFPRKRSEKFNEAFGKKSIGN